MFSVPTSFDVDAFIDEDEFRYNWEVKGNLDAMNSINSIRGHILEHAPHDHPDNYPLTKYVNRPTIKNEKSKDNNDLEEHSE